MSPSGVMRWFDSSSPTQSAAEGQTGKMQPMALSNKEKQEAYRQRRAEQGLQEVRGIFLPPELHAELKALAAKLLKKAQKAPSAK